jgi:hypothetical protein
MAQQGNGSVTTYDGTVAITVDLTDDQEGIREGFKEALAGWLARHSGETRVALIAAGMEPDAALETTYDVVSELVESGWENYLRAVSTS